MAKQDYLKFNTLQMSYFLTVANCGSFTNAARMLYTNQSTLSKMIQSLEQMLGVTLFIRSHKRLILTEAGAHLKKKWEQILMDIENSVEECRVLQGGYSNMLIIGLLDSHDPETFVLPDVKSFQNKNPQVTLTINICSAQEIKQRLINGSLDLAYTILYDMEQLKTDDLEYVVVEECSQSVAMLNTNPLAKKDYLEIKDLEKCNFVAISPLYTPSYCGMIRELCQENGFKPNFTRYVNSALALAYNLMDENDIFICNRNYRGYHHPSFSVLQFRPLIHTRSGIVAVWNKHNRKEELKRFIKHIEQKQIL